MKSPGSAGVPPAKILAQPRPSPRPGSTGKDARALLRPGPCGSRRQGGRLAHRGETERQAKGEDAGGTPALPGGPAPITLAPQGGGRRLAGPQPCRCGRAVTLSGPSCSFADNSFFFCFRQGLTLYPITLHYSLSTLHYSLSTLITLHSPPGCAPQREWTSSGPIRAPMASASNWRLILREAVRGKSSGHIR